ncbi:MAG TPA: hypothetical protein VHA73_07750 [Acidimicrobiales bacterium]|jgi:hypothetical protein|nr:hypothetical protein [Acidimicrobiales bacterium]
MEGPAILVEALRDATIADKYGNRWQYHSRSDRHSKVACWGIGLDLLSSSALLRRHVAEGKVILGVNHTMRDFGTGRKKDLDLVLARPEGEPDRRITFGQLAERYSIPLSARQRMILEELPELPVAPVGAVLIALEAKATMTAHIRALPRLYDELNSSHLCVHGASRQALAIGFAIINASGRFASSDMNKFDLSKADRVFTEEPQPRSLVRTLEKIAEMPRRSNTRETGFDGVGVVVIDGPNDGTPFRLVTAAPAPQPGEPFHYDGMIARMANEYDTSFSSI